MRTWSAIVMGLLLAGALALVALRTGPAKSPAVVTADAATDGSTGADGSSGADGSTGTTAADAGPSAELDAGTPTEDGGEAVNDAGSLIDGEAPPALAGEAPKTVTFGVILVTYRGAQGAPQTARTKDEAMTLAKQLAEEAKTDFKAALAKGDKGSVENAGRMPRGMLEPAPEFLLFSLAKGAVSEPVDTPRGFWIMQRIE